MPSLSPRRRHSVSLPETAPTGPPQRIDQPTTPTPNPSKSTIAAITITHATNGTLISGSLARQVGLATDRGGSFADAEARDNLPVRTTLSGEVMQDGNTRQFIFTIPEIVSYLSQGVTLEPGDLIATGTPGGVGDERKPPRYLLEGDVVEVEIPGVGKISNRVRIEA